MNGDDPDAAQTRFRRDGLPRAMRIRGGGKTVFEGKAELIPVKGNPKRLRVALKILV